MRRLIRGLFVLIASSIWIWPAPAAADDADLSEQIEALSSDDQDVRFDAVLEIRRMGTAAARAQQELIRLLDDPVAYVRREAADAMLRVGGDVELVLPLLEDSDQSVQLGVARSILVDGRKAEAAIPVLVFLASDAEFPVDYDAETTFEAFSPGLARRTAGALLEVIETEDDSGIRFRAHGALQRMDAIGPEHIARLVLLLQRDEDDIREIAAERLAWLREEAEPAIPALQEALNDDEAAVRIQAALALLSFESTREASVAVLQGSMDEGSWAVRLMSIHGLQDIRVPELVPQLIAGLGRSPVSWESYEALVRLGRNAVPELVMTIQARDANGNLDYPWDMIAKVLAGIGADAVDATEALLLLSHDPIEDVQAEAAHALGSVAVESKSATDRLVEMLGSPIAEVRQAAAEALQTTTPASRSDLVRAELRNRLNDEGQHVRVSAARSLGGLGEEAVVFLPVLEEHLAHEDGTVVEAVLEAYKELGPRGAASVPSLIGMLNTDAYVPGFALGFESRVGGRSLNREVPWTFKVIGRPAVPALTDALDHPDPEIRGHAAESLGLIGPDAAPAVPALVKLLSDDGAESRIVGWVGAYRTVADIAAETLGLIGPSASQAIPALLQRLEAFQRRETSRENVRLVAQALGRIGPDAAPTVPALWVLSRTGGWWEQSEALAALARIQPDDPEVRETLKRFLLDIERDDPFAVNSIEAVGIVGDAIVDVGEWGRDLAPVLEYLITDAPLLHPLQRCEAAAALARIDPEHPLPERYLRRQARIEQVSGGMLDWAQQTLEWLHNADQPSATN